jgi:8-oxo-dGTP pyrophosphatase MutT (NUDIX family)
VKTIDEEIIAESLLKKTGAPTIFTTANGLRRASVLILFVCIDQLWHILYTRRTNAVENHKGQVAFPGGGEEPEDTDPIATALRETNEEIGVPAECVKVLGTIPEIPTHSGFLITPVVGRMEWPVHLIPSVDEVSRIFMVPLDWLANPDHWEERDFTRSDNSQEKVVFYRPYDGEIVWGITGRITLILLETLGLISTTKKSVD